MNRMVYSVALMVMFINTKAQVHVLLVSLDTGDNNGYFIISKL